MKTATLSLLGSLAVLSATAPADMYMHYPRGSNDRTLGALTTQFKSSGLAPTELASHALEKGHHKWGEVTVTIVGGSRAISSDSIAAIESAYKQKSKINLPFSEVQIGKNGSRKVIYRWNFQGVTIESAKAGKDGADPALTFTFKFKRVTCTHVASKQTVTDSWS
ncbi:MAG TPA: hypothetical protein VKT78_02965 [Fimbriimonadaceae bacterium]|nr:hypothetical protein [Fimbriimonadaceae bacterium]